MITLTETQLNTLRYGPAALFTCVSLFIDDGPYHFWNGPSNHDIDGTTFLSIGAFGWATAVGHSSDMAASGIELVLDATRILKAANDETDPGLWVATVIANGGYRQRRMNMAYSIWNADTGEHVMQRRTFTGVIDQMAIRYDPSPENGLGACKLIVRCEAITLRYGQRLGRIRSHEDQREIAPTDDFYKFCTGSVIRERTLQWGKAGGSAGAPTQDSFGLIDTRRFRTFVN